MSADQGQQASSVFCVVDPQVPAHDRVLIERLPAHRRPRPGAHDVQRPSWASGSGVVETAMAVAVVTVGGTLTVLLLAGTVGLFSQDSGFLRFLGFLALLLAVAAGILTAVTVSFIREETNSPDVRLRQEHYQGFLAALRHPGRYHVPEVMHPDDAAALARAVRAVVQVQQSTAHRSAALDSVHGTVEFAERLWRLGQDLRELRPHLDRLAEARRQIVSEEGRRALERAAGAHREAQQAIDRRVAEIENYARRVMTLDAKMAESAALLRLAGRQDDLRVLLVRLVDGPLEEAVTASLDAELQEALRAAVVEARAAAEVLNRS